MTPLAKAIPIETCTYKICVDSCEHPKIVGEFGGLELHEAMNGATLALVLYAFRKVDVICEQTGEVIYNAYYANEAFTPCISYGEVINYLYQLSASN